MISLKYTTTNIYLRDRSATSSELLSNNSLFGGQL